MGCIQPMLGTFKQGGCMGFIYAFISDWNFIFSSGDKYANIAHKYSKLLFHLKNDETSQSKWIRIIYFCKYVKNLDIDKLNKLSDKWILTCDLISKKGDENMKMNDGIIYMEITPKISVIVYPDNSALFMRKIVGNAVVNTAKIPNIYDESEATKILYQASESSAYDTLKKLRKAVEKMRFSEMVIEEELEDV